MATARRKASAPSKRRTSATAKNRRAVNKDAKNNSEAKEKAQAELQKAHDAAEKKLVPLGKEINTRLDKADKYATQAADHRVAAALQLAAAKDVCDSGKINFKEWCDNIFAEVQGRSYESVRKLARAGASGDEEQTRLAIEHMRLKEAEASKKARDKKKTESKKPVDPETMAETAMESLDDDKVTDLVSKMAKKRGLKLIENTEMSPLERAMFAFDELNDEDKMELIKYASFVMGVDSFLDEEYLEYEESKKEKKRRRKAA